MSANKTEQATPHKLKKAKQKGDVPRSKELANAVVIGSFIVGIIVIGYPIGNSLSSIFLLSFSGTQFLEGGSVVIINEIKRLFILIFSISLWVMFHTIIGTIILGGFIISSDKIKPKASNLSLAKGFKKVVSMQNVFETIKALVKLAVIGSVTYLFITSKIADFITIRWVGRDDLVSMITTMAITYLAIMGFILILFALVDIPFQIKTFKKKMMMSLQEIKDEFKQTEGSPEMKGKMKRRQREIAERRHIPDTKDATVVFTNPTHFSIAIFFDDSSMEAPRILSMGADNNAFKIRDIATQYEIPILNLPPLARSLYRYGEIGKSIPEDLYEPVALVLAYLMGLDDPMYHNVGDIQDNLVLPESMHIKAEDI